MKRRFSIVLAVGVLLSLTSFATTAQKEAPARRVFTADTGIVTLGPNQMLRLSCVTRDGAAVTIGFRRLEYAQGSCNSGVCTHTLSSDTTTGPVMLMPGEGASVDIPNTAFGVRGKVLSSRQNVKVTAQIINSTGEVVGFFDVFVDLD